MKLPLRFDESCGSIKDASDVVICHVLYSLGIIDKQKQDMRDIVEAVNSRAAQDGQDRDEGTDAQPVLDAQAKEIEEMIKSAGFWGRSCARLWMKIHRLTAEAKAQAERIEELQKCSTCGEPLSRDCPRCKEKWAR